MASFILLSIQFTVIIVIKNHYSSPRWAAHLSFLSLSLRPEMDFSFKKLMYDCIQTEKLKLNRNLIFTKREWGKWSHCRDSRVAFSSNAEMWLDCVFGCGMGIELGIFANCLSRASGRAHGRQTHHYSVYVRVERGESEGEMINSVNYVVEIQ